MLYNFFVAILKVILLPFFRVRVDGIENLKEDENFIICANHKSNFDPFLLALVLPVRIHFMAKKELFENPLLAKLLSSVEVFPVDRHGKNMKSLRFSMKLVKEGKTLGVFPEGTRVKETKRENMKEGVAFLSLKGKANILPVELISTYKPFKKSYIHVHEMLRVEDYLHLDNKTAMKKIEDDVFEAIYKDHYVEEGENKWK